MVSEVGRVGPLLALVRSASTHRPRHFCLRCRDSDPVEPQRQGPAGPAAVSPGGREGRGRRPLREVSKGAAGSGTEGRGDTRGAQKGTLLAFSRSYMATSGLDHKLHIYDLRAYRRLHSLLLPSGAGQLDFSQRGLLGAACQEVVQVSDAG